MPKRFDLTSHLLADSVDQALVVGPVLTRPDVAGWYFIIAGAGAEGFRCDQFVAPEGRATAEARRVEIIAHLTQRGGLMLHLIEDELDMARMCELLWPSTRTTKLRQQVEAERHLSTNAE